jgi:pilus assembly protein Flp/PilA
LQECREINRGFCQLGIIGFADSAVNSAKETIMNSLRATLSNLVHDESGQDLIEYALLAAIIALGATAAMGTLASAITGAFTTVGTRLTSNV